MRELQPTIRACDASARAVPAPDRGNRIDQRVAEYETWDELKGYCVHSADPVGRLVLGVLRPRRRARAASRLGRRLHRPAARELPAGRAARSRARAGLPAGGGPAPLRRRPSSTGRTSRCGGCSSSRPSGRAACWRRRAMLRTRIGGRVGPGGRALRARRARRARGARARRLGRLHAAAAALARAARAGGDSQMTVEAGLRRGRADHARAGAQLRLRDHGAAAAEAAGDRRDLRLRARGRRRGRRRAARRTRSARGSRSCDARSTAARRRRDARWRSPTRARATRFPPRRCTISSTAACRTPSRTRYADFDELRGYCRHVAGAVGVACVAVYGSDERERAETLGVALQLINIVRDVREDWELGRVYLPQDELAAYGVSRGGHRRGPRRRRSGGR